MAETIPRGHRLVGCEIVSESEIGGNILRDILGSTLKLLKKT